VDPEAVIAQARGSIDESLLTSTGGGLLGRKVLADEPLVAHLREEETLQYLLAGAAAPTRVEDGTRRELETAGSYWTLLAVTDARLLLVAGSADGDRRLEFRYPTVGAVEARSGLLTDTAEIEAVAGPRWEVTVRAGSDVRAAVAYASEQAAAAEAPGDVAGPEGSTPGGPEVAGPETATGDPPGASATIESFLADASESADEQRSKPAPGTDEAIGSEDESTGANEPREADSEPAVRPGQNSSTPVDGLAGSRPGEEPRGPDGVGDGNATDGPIDQKAAGARGGRRRDTGHAEDAATVEGPLATALFAAVVDEASMPSVEGYASGDVDRVLGDAEAHHERMRDQLAAGELGAARGAAATVEALAREGDRLATEQGDESAGRRAERLRRATRWRLLDAALGVEDLSVLEGPELAALKALLQGVDPEAFEQLVADLWSELGYQTAVTQSSKDEGVDVVARQSTPVEQTVVIQAKRYGPTTKVGREEVQQYASLHRQEPEADLVVVVTTGEFTGPAREASSDLDVKLVDGDRLVEILLDRDLYDVVARYA
jgi:hypothetical protein